MRLLILAPLVLLAGCARQYAGPAPPQAPDGTAEVDPPTRVARLSYLEGPVSFRAAAADPWVAADLNRPLSNGDYLWTDQAARAELSTGSAAFRLDSRTGIGVLNIDGGLTQLKLSEGLMQSNVRSLEADEAIEIDTPSAAVILQRTGEYRIEVNSVTGATRVSVRAGLAEIVGAGEPAAASVLVRAGQEATVGGANATTAAETRPLPPLDAFDQFCSTRERAASTTEALQHVPRDVVGWEDLDTYGSWSPHPTYGSIWYPRSVAPGWAPYRFGHWVWIDPWGWTWVDDAPWGFAPFHYGRWLFYGTRWCWVPVPPRVRVVYAPALVVFVGGGRPGLRLHVGLASGLGIGWFPLGPREVYVPPYRASSRYVTNLNLSHTVIRNPAGIGRTNMANQQYVNRRISGAVTLAPEDAFVSGRRIAPVARPATSREAASYRIGGTAAPVAPTARSLAGESSERSRPVSRPPASVSNRRVVTRRAPPAQQPSFEQRRPELERNPGRPLDSRQIEDMRGGRTASPPSGTRQPAARPTRTTREDRSAGRARQADEQRRGTIEREHRSAEPTGGNAAPRGGRIAEGRSSRRPDR